MVSKKYEGIGINKDVFMEEYRVDIKIRNNLFLKKIEAAGYKTIGELLRKNGLLRWASDLGNVINMKLSPINSRGEFRPFIEKIADLINCSPIDLFSDIQLNTILKTNKRSIQVNEAEMKFMLENNNEPKLLEDIISDEQQNNTIEKILNTLTNKEKEILNMRFGMGEYDHPHTLKECGEKYNVTGTRIREIENRALRKLRHPIRSNPLRDFIEEN
jgi:RNA polymerase sigma factor (sigma-70 family)